MMIIAVDVDDVLADFTDQLIVFYNKTYNTSFKKKDFTSYDFWDIWGGTKEETIHTMNQFFKSKYFERISPIEGSLHAIRLLEKKHELIIVTSRYTIVADKTISWLRKHYSDSFKEIHFSYYDKNISKSELCRKLGAQVIIDDAEKNILDCAKIGMTVLVYDCPWNKHIKTNDKITRVHNWNDIIKVISKLKI